MRDAIEAYPRAGGGRLRRVVFSAEAIERRVREMGGEIASAYPADEELVVFGLLKGSFIFVADLVRRIERPLRVDFIVAASYGAGTVTSGEVRLLHEPQMSVEGRHVLLVEDIVDSGTTLNRLVPMLRGRGPESLEICALLHKRTAGDLVLEPRWVGFDAPDAFLVGYGLDRSEEFRNLPFIASV
ncbi:MAG: hypoxanthine phosphoribosyltransferase [Gemmatimonadota bacterium]